MVSPAKNRSFTSSAATGNSFASRSRASSSSRRSSSVATAGPVSRSRSTRFRPPPRFRRLRSRGVVDQHPPHRLGRGGEEVPSTVELLVPDQPQVSLVHQGGGAEGVPGVLRGHPRGRELSQLVVDEREQVGRRLAVAGRRGVEEVSDLGHKWPVYRLQHNVRTGAIQDSTHRGRHPWGDCVS